MPRKDPTFTDQDLLRFYCRNLDQTEKFSEAVKKLNYLSRL